MSRFPGEWCGLVRVVPAKPVPAKAGSGNPYVDGPLLARVNAACERSDCDHMSGLLSRSHMTAAKMGFATRGPNIIAMSGTDGFPGVSRVLRSIDHTICSVSSKLRPQREAMIARALNGVFRVKINEGSWRASFGLVAGTIASFRPTAALQAPCASGVKAGRRPPPQAARSGLDGASTALHCRSGGRSGSWAEDRGCSVRR